MSAQPGRFANLRCPCHNLLFSNMVDYNQHMNPVAFSSVGTGNYQEWVDTLNIHAPKPGLVPTKTNHTLRRITESHKHRKNRTHIVAKEPTGPTSPRTVRIRSGFGASLRGMPPAFKALSELISPIGTYQNFLYYLMHYGTINQQDEYAPSQLDEDSLAEIQTLFDALDTDNDGLINQGDISVAADMIGSSYNPLFFRKIDKTRKGNADIVEVVKAFFPHYSLKRLGTIIQKISKPPPTVLTTREQLSPEHRAEIDKLYNLYASLPGGCTLKNMLSQLSAYQRERSDTIAVTFAQFDSDGDGVLSLEDYSELVKFSYPPFKQSETFVEELDSSHQDTSHQLDKDRRIFFPSIENLMAPAKPYGVQELMTVKAGTRQNKANMHLNKQSRLLHLSPTVRHYAGDPHPNLLGDEGSDDD